MEKYEKTQAILRQYFAKLRRSCAELRRHSIVRNPLKIGNKRAANPFVLRLFLMVEVGGVEPPSYVHSTIPSTCLVSR